MDDFSAVIQADGGAWSEVEVLGNQAIVKVVGVSSATLTTIASGKGFTRVPLDRLDAPLSSLTAPQRAMLRSIILNAGYTLAEANSRFPNLANNTLGEALRFLASRRRKPRYDAATDSIVLDGAEQPCQSLDELDGALT